MHKLLTVFLIVLIWPLSISASDDPLTSNPSGAWYLQDAEQGWHFDVGLGVEFEPGYPGSDEYSSEPDVLARAVYRTEQGHRLFITPGEIGGIYSISPDTQFVAFLEFEEAREVDEDPALIGLDPVDSTIEGQFILAHRFGKKQVFAVLQPDLTGDANKGVVWFAGVGYDTYLQDRRWRFATTFDISGADAEHMNTEFGINAEEVVRTGYTTYEAGAALKSATLGLQLVYQFTSRLSLLGNVETEYYFSEASDSPLINDEGNDITYEASLLLRWEF